MVKIETIPGTYAVVCARHESEAYGDAIRDARAHAFQATCGEGGGQDPPVWTEPTDETECNYCQMELAYEGL